MEQGTVLEWHVDKGSNVSEGELLAEIESEKSIGEIEAREDGVLREIVVKEGDFVEPGVPIAIVASQDEDIAGLYEEIEGEVDGADSDSSERSGEDASAPAETATSQGSSSSESKSQQTVRASPRAKKRAEELSIDLQTVDGSGPGGAITADDVEAAETTNSEGKPSTGLTLIEERKFNGMRQTIANRLSQSYRNAVHVTTHRKVNAEELLKAANAADKASDGDVSMSDILLLALSATLAEHDEFNATFEDNTHQIYADHNICVAVDIEEGLIAPALRGVESMSVEDIATERRALTDRALNGEFTNDDLQDGTFTVTNLGVLGVESFDPVINPPQVAILGVNAIGTRPQPDADQGFTFQQYLPLDLSFDHRVVDGADAARFLQTLKEHIENPWSLLL